MVDTGLVRVPGAIVEVRGDGKSNIRVREVVMVRNDENAVYGNAHGVVGVGQVRRSCEARCLRDLHCDVLKARSVREGSCCSGGGT